MQQTPFIWLIDDDEATLDIISRAFTQEQLAYQFKLFTNCQSLLV